MKQIKFSHNYPKVHNQETALLVQVKLLEREELHEDLVRYDTAWNDGNSLGFYELPKGKVIHLTFIGDKEIPFCTIRRYTPVKLHYYMTSRKESFEIITMKDDKS